MQGCFTSWRLRSAHKATFGAKRAIAKEIPNVRILRQALEVWAFAFVRGEFLRKTFSALNASFSKSAALGALRFWKAAVMAESHYDRTLTTKAFLSWEKQILLQAMTRSADILAKMHANRKVVFTAFSTWRSRIGEATRAQIRLRFDHWYRAWQRKSQLRRFLGQGDAVID
jgi:hypothetical protein